MKFFAFYPCQSNPRLVNEKWIQMFLN
jgi:hypothetical protein